MGEPVGKQQDKGPSETALLLLRINQALLLASSEQEILAAIALCADASASLHLIYLDDSKHPADTARVVAAWEKGKLQHGPTAYPAYPAEVGGPGFSRLTSYLAASENPIWLVEDTSHDLELALSANLQDVRSLVAIKLCHVGFETEYRWHSVICFTWPTPHTFTSDEKYIYAALSQFAAAVVSNHRMHTETLKHVEHLRGLNRLKNEFLGSVSHELRTPLVGVLTISDAILNGVHGAIPETLRGDIQWIHKSGEQLLSVITDILDVARLESGENIELELEAVNIFDLINEAITLVRRTMAYHKTLSIEFDGSAKLPHIWADKTRIRQILLNLLTNAVKFTERGVVMVKACEDAGTLVVSVQDEGIGIPPDQQALIFEPFRQIDGSLSRKAGGAGLGLAICKRLIELHRGRIWVESTPGEGSCFYFSLPLTRSQ